MEKEQAKLKRSIYVIKGFMLVLCIIQVVQIIQTRVWDFGQLVSVTGILLVLRGLLLSPQLLTAPLTTWHTSNRVPSKHSYQYFACGIILIFLGNF